MALDKQKSPAVLSCIIFIKSSFYKKNSLHTCVLCIVLCLYYSFEDYPHYGKVKCSTVYVYVRHWCWCFPGKMCFEKRLKNQTSTEITYYQKYNVYIYKDIL